MSIFKKTPSLDSVKATLYAEQTIARQAAAPIRLAFMIDEHNTGLPPVVRLLRGGRGGEVRLKLFLSMLWLAPRRTRREMPFRSSFWAELLDLDDPSGRGARRIGEAISWLEQQHFISAIRRPGYAPQVTLLDERGGGVKYEHPPGSYIKLPAEFWTRRWIQDLSGAALALFLVVLAELYRYGPRLSFWVAPKVARAAYGLSADTWTKASGELSDLGLVHIGRAKLRGAHVDILKKRNTYRLASPSTMSEPVTWDELGAAVRATLSARPLPIVNPQSSDRAAEAIAEV